MAQLTPGSSKGTAEFKADGTVTSTFTLDDGRTFTYNGTLHLPDTHAVKPCVCDVVLNYNTQSAPGLHAWTSEKVGNRVKVIVNSDTGNTIVIDMPEESFVLPSDHSRVHYFPAEEAPSGSFTLV